MGTDSSAKNNPNAPEFICPSPKVLVFNKKKASLGVRSPWIYLIITRLKKNIFVQCELKGAFASVTRSFYFSVCFRDDGSLSTQIPFNREIASTLYYRCLVGSTNQAFQVASTSELHENQWNNLLFFEIVPSHCFRVSEA